MGYYGLGPGDNSRRADPLTAYERALRSLPMESALEALTLLEKVAKNIIRQPLEEKFRRLNTANEKLAPLLGHQPGLDLMQEIGWQVDGDFVFLPNSVKLDFQEHVAKLVDARDFYQKEAERLKRAARITGDAAKAEALRLIDVDRQERAATYGYQANSANAAIVSSAPVQPAAAAAAPVVPNRVVEQAVPVNREARADAPAPRPSIDQSGDPRHDFGPGFMTRCAVCRKITWNRGDRFTRTIYCIPCFLARPQ